VQSPASAIVARGLTRDFGRVRAVDGIDLDIPRARIYGFLGPNGSGKSTTIRMLCGLLRPTAGSVAVLGHEMPRDAERLRRSLGYMTQKFSLWDDLTVRENLEFMARIFGLDPARRRARIDAASEEYGLHALLGQRAGTMSVAPASARRWRWPGRRCTSRSCCCSTSPPARSTRRAGATSGRACSRWSSAA